MHGPRSFAPPVPGGFGFPLGFLTTVIVVFAAVAGGASTHPLRSLIALAAATALMAGLTTFGATVATTAAAWALHAGFVLGRHGELAFTPTATRAALVLATTALLVSAVATAARRT